MPQRGNYGIAICLENFAVRGEHSNRSEILPWILENHDYRAAVKNVLAEL